MKSSETLSLPIPASEYTVHDQEVLRRSIEQAYTDLREDMLGNRDGLYAPASLSQRHRQFLLMGAT